MIQLYKEEFVEIGHIRKGYGYKGHAKIAINNHFENDLEDQQFLFFEIDGYKVPFLIEEKLEQKELILKFQFIDSIEELRKYQQAPLFILKKELKYALDYYEEKRVVSSYVGLSIHDMTLGDLGPIIRVDQYPQQDMAVIVGKDREILIPLHASLILEVIEQEKILKMDLPEGLF